jgi:hypothetical protein
MSPTTFITRFDLWILHEIECNHLLPGRHGSIVKEMGSGRTLEEILKSNGISEEAMAACKKLFEKYKEKWPQPQ